tara:strand:+ start:916 stop:1293 length:378 start_codon:yes stop_codon:yes gene_type:complete
MTYLTNRFKEIFIKKLFSWKGRCSRTEYVIRILGIIVLIIISWLLMIISIETNTSIFTNLSIVITIFYVLQVIPLDIRRLHDLNFSGWWVLLTTIPYLGMILFIPFIFLKGTKGSNKYGEEPKTL